MRVLSVWVAGFALAVLGATPWASADSLHFDLDFAFSGGPSTPGANVDLLDVGVNQVQVTLSVPALNQGRYNDWYLNLDPGLAIGGFSVGAASGQAYSSLNFGTNAFKADGDGWFDINVTYANNPTGSLTAGESTTFVISYVGVAPFDGAGTLNGAGAFNGAGTFNVHSFNFFSVDGIPGEGNYRAAVHVTSIGEDNEDSVWMGDPGTVIPLPGAAMAGLVLMGLVGLRRRHA